MKVNHESAARLPDRCGLGGVDGRVQPIPGRLEGVVPRRRFEHISIRIELAPIQEIEHQMRAMTSARGEGIGNEARESHRVRVVYIDAGSALSLGKPEWPRASAMRRDDDARSVTGYVFDQGIGFDDWSSADEWPCRRWRCKYGRTNAGRQVQGLHRAYRTERAPRGHLTVRPSCFSQPPTCRRAGSWWVQWITPPLAFHSYSPKNSTVSPRSSELRRAARSML